MIPFRKTARSLLLTAAGSVRSRLSPGIHILNGHGLSIDNGDAAPDAFDELLAKLRRVSEFIRIEEAAESLLSGDMRDGVYVAFTFDDGYRECYSGIAPALVNFGTNAAFFVNPGFINGDSDYCADFFARRAPDLTARAPMTRDMLRELAAGGFVIGAHTHDHVRLVGLDAAQIERQVVQCRFEVESITGVSCDYFAWTYGKYADIDPAALDAVLATYRYVFSSDRYWESASLDGRVINRRHFECDWPFSHVKYFLSRPRAIHRLAGRNRHAALYPTNDAADSRDR